MLTLKTLRDDPQAVVEKLAIKNFDAKPIVDRVLELDSLRRSLQTESDAILSQQKTLSSQIGALMKQGLKAEAEAAAAAAAPSVNDIDDIFRIFKRRKQLANDRQTVTLDSLNTDKK